MVPRNFTYRVVQKSGTTSSDQLDKWIPAQKIGKIMPTLNRVYDKETTSSKSLTSVYLKGGTPPPSKVNTRLPICSTVCCQPNQILQGQTLLLERTTDVFAGENFTLEPPVDVKVLHARWAS